MPLTVNTYPGARGPPALSGREGAWLGGPSRRPAERAGGGASSVHWVVGSVSACPALGGGLGLRLPPTPRPLYGGGGPCRLCEEKCDLASLSGFLSTPLCIVCVSPTFWSPVEGADPSADLLLAVRPRPGAAHSRACPDPRAPAGRPPRRGARGRGRWAAGCARPRGCRCRRPPRGCVWGQSRAFMHCRTRQVGFDLASKAAPWLAGERWSA